MWEPQPDPDAAGALGETLRELGYDEDAIDDRLGDEGIAADIADVAVHARRLDHDELGDVIRLLLLAQPVRRARFAGAAELVRLGLATEADGLVMPRARIVPTEGVYLAFDTFSHGAHDPPGWVASFTPTAYWLASLTVRRRVRRALDIGTGNGVHALLAARHADEVVATDVNPRALAFTQISAALNDLHNVETRLGSLFEPVAGETFGLITCNAPYVISPKARWQYRDAGYPGDEFSRLVVTSAAAHLEDDGFASVLVSWLAPSYDEADEHVREWLAGTGCDAWILAMDGSDPIDHAAGWNDHLSSDQPAFAETLDEWASYFADLGAGWISEGGVVMHRRAGNSHVVRAIEVDEDELEYASDQLERVFRGLAAVADQGEGVVDRRLRLVDDTLFQQELDRTGEILSTTLVLDEGTCSSWELSVEAAAVLIALDGATTLDQAVARVARREELSKSETADLRSEVRALAVELLEVGALELL
jgi:methylase of polypeptide subunit release factors